MPDPKPARNEPAIRVVMMPRDTNSLGNIFGGVILSYIDQAAFVEARRQACHKYVTVRLDEVVFKEPVGVGDVLSLYAQATRIGRTSMHIHVDVVAEPGDQAGSRVSVTHADVVMVALGPDGRPTPIEMK